MPITVLPPATASSANDLWHLDLPADIEAANDATHNYCYPEFRCGYCDCRPGGAWSRFACTRTLTTAGNTEALTWEEFTAPVT